MNQLNLLLPLVLSYSCYASQPETAQGKTNSPNLLIIQTDEHNFRTLGCYRTQLSHDQAFMWGDDNQVQTPNIDYLAKNGVMFTKFYAATPVCSPSRGSLVSGMYPQFTGVPVNDVPMNRNIVTFAEVLSKAGYQTGFIGKWHLDGEAKPGWEPASNFGFEDNKYMYNRGHWKKLVESVDGPHVGSLNNKGIPADDLNGADDKSYTTDFLTDRAIRFFKKNASAPFCLYLSYPDPHGPDTVRVPYNQMYKNLPYKAPVTYDKKAENAPSWASPMNNVEIDQSQYFGMVKCIDDNIGRLLEFLKSEKLIDNTIIIFTSDHGDLCAEHHRINKTVPLEASAKVPFIISYPSRIPSGAVVNNAFNTVDFAPTILHFLNQKVPAEMQGRNFAGLLTNPDNQKKWEDITFMRATGLGNTGDWVAAVTSRYKLILSKNDVPWLLDLQEDPYELINFISKPEMKPVVKELAKQLSNYAQKRNDPFLQGTKMAEDLKTLM